MDEYEKFEMECENIRKENEKLLNNFEQYLNSKKLSQKTIAKHVGNIDFYINDFLLYEEPEQPQEGITKLNYFFSYWFIRKAMWASVSSIKENITSLKHFYTYMHSIGEVKIDELIEMKEDIKECKEEWFSALHDFDNPKNIW